MQSQLFGAPGCALEPSSSPEHQASEPLRASVSPTPLPEGSSLSPLEAPSVGIAPERSTQPDSISVLQQRIGTLERALAEAQQRAEREHGRFLQLSSIMGEAMILVDERGRVLHANDRVSAYSGLSATELIYEYGRRYHASPEGESPLEEAQMPLARALRGEVSLGGELTLHTPQHEVTLRASAAPTRESDGRLSGALLVFEDVSRRSRAERRNELIQEVSELLSQSLASEVVMPRLAEMVGDVMGAWSVLALVQLGEDALDLVGAWHPDSSLHAELQVLARELRILQSVDPGMGYVARTGRPVLRSDMPDLTSMPGLEPSVVRLFERLGSASLLIVPLMSRQVCLGAMMLVSLPGRRRFRDEDLEFCTWLVERIAARLDGARLLESLRGSERRMRLLAQLSRQLGTSLELPQVLRSVSTHLTEALGDGCVVGLLTEDGEGLSQQIRYHRNMEIQDVLERRGPPTALPSLPALVCRTLTPVLLTDLRLNDPYELMAPLQEQLCLAEPTSYVCLPVTARGRAFGYIELVCETSSQRRLEEGDLELLVELALRASDALQHALLYEELHSLIRAKDDWLSVASHELKTPLTPLQVMLQLMERKVKRGETIQIEQIERSINQVRALITLINDLLDISQFELGTVALETIPLDMAGIVTAASQKVASTTLEHRIRFRDYCPGVRVLADPIRLEQVITHLLTNAIRYSPQGGDVEVALEEQVRGHEPCVVLSVKDSGIGVPRAEQHRLFQRYFRASNVSERNYGGLGLGLWMSHEIVTRLHGHIWAESKEGEGSQFFVALPVLSEGVQTKNAQPRVLLVGELQEALPALRARLGGLALELLVVPTCVEGLKLIPRKLPQLVVADLALPYLEVLELLQRVRRLAGAMRVSILLAGSSSSQVTMSRELNATDFLVKPVDGDLLAQRIIGLLDLPNLSSDSSGG